MSGPEVLDRKSVGNTGPPTSSKTRGWTLTLWDENALSRLIDSEPDYLVYAPEQCPSTGKEHFQCYAWYKGARHQSAMRKLFTGHDVQIARGNHQHNRTYIVGPYEKDGKHKPFNPDHVEIGEIPQQGKRTDICEKLQNTANDIRSGKRKLELLDSNPEVTAKYPRWVEQYTQFVDEEGWPKHPKLDWFPWQQWVLDYLKMPPDPRQILWIYDRSGGQGKSTLMKYLGNEDTTALVDICGRKMDIFHSLAQRRTYPSIITIDCKMDSKDINWEALEAIKDAYFVSHKYSSKTIRGAVPHVVICSNTNPSNVILAKGRLRVVEIRDKKIFGEETI